MHVLREAAASEARLNHAEVVAEKASPSDEPGMTKSLECLLTKVDDVSKVVTGMAGKLGMLIDAVSGNTKQTDAHGNSLEGMGKAVMGLRSSIDKLLNACMGSDTPGSTAIGSPAEDGFSLAPDEDVDPSSGDEEEGPAAAKVRRGVLQLWTSRRRRLVRPPWPTQRSKRTRG